MECKGHTSHRDLYLKQFTEAKENVTYLQRQLMIEQKAMTDLKVKKSIKEQEISDLKAKIDEQTRRALNEKEELIRKLEELNVELKDRQIEKDVHKDQLQVLMKIETEYLETIHYIIYKLLYLIIIENKF